jgi:hypothetical protein
MCVRAVVRGLAQNLLGKNYFFFFSHTQNKIAEIVRAGERFMFDASLHIWHSFL